MLSLTIYILALHNGMAVRGLPVVLLAGYSEESRSVFSTRKCNTSGGLLGRKTLMCRTTTELLSGTLIIKQ